MKKAILLTLAAILFVIAIGMPVAATEYQQDLTYDQFKAVGYLEATVLLMLSIVCYALSRTAANRKTPTLSNTTVDALMEEMEG